MRWRNIVSTQRLNFWLLAISFCAISLFVGRPKAETTTVGTVTRVQQQVEIAGAPAVVGSAVHMQDELRTGDNARLEVTFSDSTKLTLGEHARVVVDRYVFNPDRSIGQLALTSTQGALRFATGKIGQMHDKTVTVNTPMAALAVRGTEFWMGPIDGHYGALLLKGKVTVTGRRAKR